MKRDIRGRILPGNPPNNFTDLTGKVFGKLMVVERGPNKVYGSRMQSKTTWRCKCECGNEHLVTAQALKSGVTQSCGCHKTAITKARRGADHQNWKGGRSINSEGYVLLTNPDYPGAPSNPTKTYQRLEHAVVMSRYLGRPLLPHETVHHKNGIRNDNRFENLELWNSSHPSGQRVVDLKTWAREILEQYPD
jgi:hypothetical protein